MIWLGIVVIILIALFWLKRDHKKWVKERQEKWPKSLIYDEAGTSKFQKDLFHLVVKELEKYDLEYHIEEEIHKASPYDFFYPSGNVSYPKSLDFYKDITIVTDNFECWIGTEVMQIDTWIFEISGYVSPEELLNNYQKSLLEKINHHS